MHTHIVGEHGDSEVPVWSSANIAGLPIADFAASSGANHEDLALSPIFEGTPRRGLPDHRTPRPWRRSCGTSGRSCR